MESEIDEQTFKSVEISVFKITLKILKDVIVSMEKINKVIITFIRFFPN